jgi:hypothetical protein
MKTQQLENTYHRTVLNCSHIAAHVYNSNLDNMTSTAKIRNIIKRTQEGFSSVKITSFRNIAKFKGTVFPLLRLLSAGGVWTTDLEKAFKELVKCRIEEVC